MSSTTAPKSDFVQTSTTISAHLDARLRILLGWRMLVKVRTPLRVSETGSVLVGGKSSVSVDEVAPRWWVWIMGKLPKVKVPDMRAAVAGRVPRV